MPPPSTSTKPRVELGELRRTQTMPSAIAHLQGSATHSLPPDAAELSCAVKGPPPGPARHTPCSPSAQAIKAFPCWSVTREISDNDDDNEECVVWW